MEWYLIKRCGPSFVYAAHLDLLFRIFSQFWHFKALICRHKSLFRQTVFLIKSLSSPDIRNSLICLPCHDKKSLVIPTAAYLLPFYAPVTNINHTKICLSDLI